MARLCLLLCSIACISIALSNTSSFEHQKLHWRACPSSLDFLQHTIECTEIKVPLDYANNNTQEIVTIEITRLPALTPRHRIGNLFYNPGGPGDAASEALNMPALAPQSWHTCIRNHFDIIGVDLRDTGLSSPILYDQDLFVKRISKIPRDEHEFSALREHNLKLREGSIKMTGRPLIYHMDTTTIARDHEIVRSTLGSERLSWLGQSGGTQLGLRYAELFPDNIRAMALDGVVAQSQVGLPSFIENAVSEDATMRQFFHWCEQQNVTICPAAHQNMTVETVWMILVARATKKPLSAPGCTPEICVNENVTVDELRNAARNTLFKPYLPGSGFAALAQFIYEAAFLNNATLAAVFIPPRAPPYVTAVNYATDVIECNHRTNDDTLVSMKGKGLEPETSTPLLGGITGEAFFESACIGWPTLPRNPPHPVHIPRNTTTLPKILLVSNLSDPATPYSWGTKVQQEIGDDRTRRVTRIASGHAVYSQPEAYEGETVSAINKYLLNLELLGQDAIFAN